ncbi:NAD(P)-binding protein [Trichoderma novae-zelandiae]
MSKVILILGGAGAQNSAVARELAKNESFQVKILSRHAKSEENISLASIPRITMIDGNCYDEDTLVSAFEGVHAVFVNTNGFAIGEKAEIFWGIRMYEIAYWAGVKHFIYSSLPYVSKKSGFNPKYRVPFVDGKAKVVDYLKAQPTDKMNWSAIESGPYPESHLATWAPKKGDDGVYVFRMPIEADGAMAMVGLADFAWYARYMFEHPKEFEADLLSVGIDHVNGNTIAAAFTAVTGEPARFEPLPLSEVVKTWPDTKIGLAGSPGYNDPTLKTMAGQFVPWFTIWQESGGNKGLWTKDYARLDQIYPGRMKTIEDWMRSVGYSTEGYPSALKSGIFG